MLSIHEYQGHDGQSLRYGKLVHPDRPVSGHPLLFIPGLGGSIKGALDFLELLLPMFSPIYGPDLRGFGLNPLEAPLHAADTLLKDLESFHQQVLRPDHQRNTTDTLTLCGISLGGLLATILAEHHPERYRELILLAPAYKPSPKTFTLTYTLRAILNFLVFRENARTKLPYGLEALTRNPLILNDPQYAEHPPLILSPGFLLGVRALAGQARESATRLTLPTLMVIPGQDIVCDPQAMRETFQSIPSSVSPCCKEYPDFYHDVLFEAEHTEIAQEILSWSNVKDSCSASSASR